MANKLAEMALLVLATRGDMEFEELSNVIYQIEKKSFLDLGYTITGARWYKREWGVEVEGLREVCGYGNGDVTVGYGN